MGVDLLMSYDILTDLEPNVELWLLKPQVKVTHLEGNQDGGLPLVSSSQS